MKIWVRAAAVIVAATVAATLVGGCGADKASEAGSFGDAAAANSASGVHVSAESGNVDAGTIEPELPEKNGSKESGQTQGDQTQAGAYQTQESPAGAGAQLSEESGTTGGQASGERETDDGQAAAEIGAGPAPAAGASGGTLASGQDTGKGANQSEQASGPKGGQQSQSPDGGSTAPPKSQPESAVEAQTGTGKGPAGRPEAPTTTTSPSSAAEPSDRGKSGGSGNQSAKTPSITWTGFFDNEDQTTPSERFWDLSDERATVRIKGFMGEVLSISANWFLLIPEPGAECPFDNGDETYWNKIMIVFVKDGTKLRYTSKPLELTGRLDVGIKVDESGYKTMFRLYDATFKEIKA